jgi:hypothetical protein
VTIVGAGIAGLSAAFYLVRAGVRVTLIEKSRFPGGKFGAVERNGLHYEHAYHFFARWCVNFLRLLRDIGVDPHGVLELRPSYGFLERPESQPGASLASRLKFLTNLGSRQWVWHNIYSGVMRWYDLVIYLYSMLDLLLENLDRDTERRAFLNRIGVNGFMASRDYITDSAALLHNNVLVRTLAIPSYNTSARTYRQFLKYAINDEHPEWLALKGNCHRLVIAPLLEAIRAQARANAAAGGGAGFTYLPETALKRLHAARALGDAVKVSGITVGAPHHSHQDRYLPVDLLLLAIPPGDLAAVAAREPELVLADPALGRLRKLNSQQMASLDLHFHHKLPGIPREHVTLVDKTLLRRLGANTPPELGFSSMYSLSFLDLSQLWEEAKSGPTVLNAVATDYEILEGLDPEIAKREFIRELQAYLGFGMEDINLERSYFQPHRDEPLLLSDVGAWDNRPEAATRIENLYLAGDFCRSEIDIASVEGAIASAVTASRAIAERVARGIPLTGVVPPTLSPPECDFDRVQEYRRILAPWLELAKRASRQTPTRIA